MHVFEWWMQHLTRKGCAWFALQLKRTSKHSTMQFKQDFWTTQLKSMGVCWPVINRWQTQVKRMKTIPIIVRFFSMLKQISNPCLCSVPCPQAVGIPVWLSQPCVVPASSSCCDTRPRGAVVSVHSTRKTIYKEPLSVESYRSGLWLKKVHCYNTNNAAYQS